MGPPPNRRRDSGDPAKSAGWTADLPIRLGLLSVLLFVGIGGYVFLAVPPPDGYTEVAILSGCDGQRGPLSNVVLDAGSTEQFTITVRNREGSPGDYRVVAQLRELRTEHNRSIVVNRTRIRTWRLTLEEGQSTELCLRFDVPKSVHRSQLGVLVYHDSIPDSPTVESATAYVLVVENATETREDSRSLLEARFPEQ